MTLEEKFELMAGDDPVGVFTSRPAIGTSDGIPRLGIPTLYFTDGPVGVREGEATAFPAPIGMAATFDPEAARRAGEVIGLESLAKGNHVLHAPTVNIMRVPVAGRTFEGFGEDPHVAARTSVPYIQGVQSTGAIGNVKHYVANNQETDRFFTNAVVAERTLREIYLPAFEASVKEADVGTVMLSYNRVNGDYVTENEPLVNGLLKGELGFDGFTLTDYGFAQRSTARASAAGTDLEMPQEGWYSGPALAAAVASGQVPESAVEEHVHRILRTMFRFGIFDSPELPASSPFDEDAHHEAAREVEEGAIVLLRNSGGALPLGAAIGSIAVIGRDADAYKGGGGSSAVTPTRTVTPLQGIRSRAPEGVEVLYDEGVNPLSAAAAAAASDVAIVFASDTQTEFVDKPCLTLQCPPGNGDQDGLIERVAAANPNTIVVLETGGPVLMPWAERVRGIVEAWYPGQAGGDAIASVLFGDADPAGRLPVTFPRRAEDVPTAGNLAQYPGIAENAEYSEGVFVGYRHYDEHGIEPLFPFGHGLSYTSFEYSNLRVVPDASRPDTATVSVDVVNSGDRRGSETPQLYLGLPEPDADTRQPPRALRGFERVELAPGESRTVTFQLDPRAFSHWDEGAAGWRVADGCYAVEVGASSRDIRLRGELRRGAAGGCVGAPELLAG